jgi:hypothetical protein
LPVAEFSLEVRANSRESAIEEIDRLSNDVLALVGGTPWLAVDDDVQKVPITQEAWQIGDDGFVFVAKKRYIYKGPSKIGPETHFHDMYHPQKTEEGRDDT